MLVPLQVTLVMSRGSQIVRSEGAEAKEVTRLSSFGNAASGRSDPANHSEHCLKGH